MCHGQDTTKKPLLAACSSTACWRLWFTDFITSPRGNQYKTSFCGHTTKPSSPCRALAPSFLDKETWLLFKCSKQEANQNTNCGLLSSESVPLCVSQTELSSPSTSSTNLQLSFPHSPREQKDPRDPRALLQERRQTLELPIFYLDCHPQSLLQI